MIQTTSSEGEHAMINRGQRPPPELAEAYWKRVKRVLNEVFEQPGSLADNLQAEVETCDPDTQTTFYNNDAFETAAELAGRDRVTLEERQTYADRVMNLPRDDRPSREDLVQAWPDE